MPRPMKQGLDYFPLDVTFDDNMELFEAECGLDGFGILIKLWQKIYSVGYYIEWNEDIELLFSRKINSEKTKVNSVINASLRRNLFNKRLYEKYKVLTSAGIQKRYITACSSAKRKNISMEVKFFLLDDEYKELITEFIELIPEEIELIPEFSTQSKVKERKLKQIESKEKYIGVFALIQEFTNDESLRTALNDFVKMRDKIKKPLTEQAFKILAKKLTGLSQDTETQVKILEESTLNCWQGIFPLKEVKTNEFRTKADTGQDYREPKDYSHNVDTTGVTDDGLL